MRRRLTALRLDKIAAVDKPCQEHATVAIIKRAPVAGTPKAIAKATFTEALEGQLVASRVNQAFYQSFDGLWERNDAFRTALTDELSEGGDGSSASEDYVASVRALVDEAVTEARKAGREASDEDLGKALSTAAAAWLATKSKTEEQTMKITTKAALKAAVAAFNPETSPAAHIGFIQKAAADLDAEDELPAQGILAKAAPVADPNLVRKVAILEMPADVRKHFDGLPAAEQDGFLAKSADDRADIVRKANEGDPVLYTCEDGTEIRKSAGAVALSLAKRADNQDKELAKLRGELTGSTLEKRAAAYPNVAKARATALLKAADALGVDTDEGKATIQTLVDLNKGAAGLFKSIGTSEGGDEGGDEGDPAAVTEFNAEVDKVAAADKQGRPAAMTKVRQSNPALFKRAYPQPEAEEETVTAA